MTDNEKCPIEALEIINELLQASSYTDAMHQVMFKIPLQLVNKAETYLDKEHFYQRRYKNEQEK